MTNHSDDGDFRARKKKVSLLGSDAEAFIRARHEEREEFKRLEGRDLDGLDTLAKDPRMEALHKQHQQRDDAPASHDEQRKDAQEVVQEEQKKLTDQQVNQEKQGEHAGRSM
ncbi:hypothetical protein [Pseudomonas sp. SG20052]|uniref:hypothetical protein n=1 Tax=Pseudomonas sp. SG20052 TaxID=3074147 RepID=UPI00287F7560|nr:hypothetical protein [Pseudomonas sp. SG20052]WNF54227.1 hypothetical protein RHP74_23285 [Pseudomonas sp. SG20052]